MGSAVSLNNNLLRVTLLSGSAGTVVFPAGQAFNGIRVTNTAGVATLLTSVDIFQAEINFAGPSAISEDVEVCVGERATLSATPAEGTTLRWYDAPEGGTLLASGNSFTSAPLTTVGQTTFFIAVVRNDCEDPIRIPVRVQVNPAPQAADLTITGAGEFCLGETVILTPGLQEGSAFDPAATTFRWYRDAARTNEILDGQEVGGVRFALNAAGELRVDGLAAGDVSFFLSAVSASGCETPAGGLLVANVRVNADAGPPVANANQLFCAINMPTLADIAVSGIGLRFFATIDDLTELPLTTPLVDGATYFISQESAAGCESAQRTAVTVQVEAGMAPVANAVQEFCLTANATLADLVVSGRNVRFFDAPTGGTALPLSTPLVNGMRYFASAETTAGCESVERTEILVNLIDCVANLNLVLAANRTRITAGEDNTFTLEVSNTGNLATGPVRIESPLPPGTQLVNASAGGVVNAGVLVWEVPNIPIGESVFFTYVLGSNVDLPDGTVLANQARGIAATDPRSPVLSNLVNVIVDAAPRADLEVLKTPAAPRVLAGESITYTIRVRNIGNAAARNVLVTDALPAGTVFESASMGGTFAAGTVSWNIAEIAAGGEATLTLVLGIPANTAAGTVIRNVAVANSADDPDGPKENAPDP
ncbi:hypothetical protein A3SI_16717, partial [Nitritalea halalkaliphila LW7]